ncbi:MAG: septation protein A [Azoarcus sp.]|jgi:intracellular septation protein|nr:septation protein A [Azoarcus sp.]
MKFFFDLFPLIVFFLAYTFANASQETAQAMASEWLGGVSTDQAPILIATATAIAATALQIAAVWLKTRKVGSMLWISLALIGVFGGATLFFRDPTFIKWKPTVLYWLFGAALIGANLLFRRNLIRSMLEKARIQLPDPVWARLNLLWALFFAALGLLNLYVAYGFTQTTWVNFKIFGCTGLIFAFTLAQAPYLSKHLIEDKPSG